MQTQLCEFCLKSGMLCSKCQTKLKTGAVSSEYIEIAKKLLSLEPQNQFLQNISLNNVVETGGFLALIVGKGDANKFNANQKFLREFSETIDKHLLVIETGMNDRKFLEELLAGQQIVTINIIWLPDGSTETRAVLNSTASKKLSKKRIQGLIDISKKVRNMDLRIEYTE